MMIIKLKSRISDMTSGLVYSKIWMHDLQISSLSVVTEAVSEAAYLYAELAHMGADMRFIDCGGGLGVDYDGTASDSHFSLPFTIKVRPSFWYNC